MSAVLECVDFCRKAWGKLAFSWALFVLVLLFPLFTRAQGVEELRDDSPVMLVARAFTSAPPQKVFYFLKISGEELPRRLIGSFVPARKMLIPTEGNRDWFVGVGISKKVATKLESYAVLILSENGKYSLLPTQRFEWNEDYIGAKSLEDFREEMGEWRETIATTEKEMEERVAELRRLRSDAELIARSQRVIDVELRIQDAEQEMEGIERDIESLKGFVQLAKSSKPPRNYARRELELTQQLKALAEATKKAESEENKRVAQGQVELHNVRMVIEQTRFEDINALQNELARLRRYRLKLEGREGEPRI